MSFSFDDDMLTSTETPPNEYQAFLWEFKDWSDESEEFFNDIVFSDSNIHFSILRDNRQKFSIYVSGYNKKESEEKFQIRLTLLNKNVELNLVKTFEITVPIQYDESKVITFPIKQSEVETKGYLSDDRISIQIQIRNYNFFSSSNYDNYDQFDISNLTIPNDSIFSNFKVPIKIETNVLFTGLKNQGATCYMNSLLQSLFHLPCFRKVVFEMEEKSDVPKESNIVRNLKLLFAQMQIQMNQPINAPREAVSTTSLTKSFGWTYENTFMQQDVQEFSRVLLDNLENKMKGTKNEDSIKQIFCGEYQTYTKGINIEFKNTNNSKFYDLSLEVKDCSDIYQSFEKYVEEQILNGDNQYNSEEFGKQDALMGIKFIQFPRILCLHLKRFEMDHVNNRSIKINSSFKFYESIDLSRFLVGNESSEKSIQIIEVGESDDDIESENDKDNIYDLYGILVHSGSFLSGHFYAYLRPNLDEKWFQFNDSLVRESSEKDAIESNFGNENNNFSAYMLIYTKRSEQKEIFQSVDNDSIPPEIIEDYFQLIEKEKEKEKIEEKEKEKKYETTNTINISLFTEKSTLIPNSKKNKLSFDFKKHDGLSFSMENTNVNSNIYSKVSELFSIPVEKIDLWKFTSKGFDNCIKNDNDYIYKFFSSNLNIFVFINNYEKNQSETEDEISFSSTSSLLSPQSFEEEFTYELEGNENDSISDDFGIFNQTEIPIFIFAYCPLNSPAFIYLYSMKVDKNKRIINLINSATKSIFEIEKDDDFEFNVYYLKSEKLNRIKQNDETFYGISCENGGIFVIECNYSEIYNGMIQKAIEKNGYNIESKEKVEDEDDNDDVIEVKSNEEEEDDDDKSDKKVVNFLDVMSIENINASEYYNFLNDFDLIKVCSVIETKNVKFPNSIQFGEFCRFLCAIFNNCSFVILFKENQIRMINENEKSVMSSIISPHDKKINAIFLDSSLINDQKEININGTFVPFENIIRFVVDISFNGISKSMTTEILVPDFFYISDIFQYIQKKGMINNFNLENTRVLEIKKRRINNILNFDESILFLSEKLRIEKVPDDQIDIENDDLIKISFSKEIQSDPFLFHPKDNASTILEIKEQIRNLINMSETEFTSFQAKFCDEKGEEITENITDDSKLNEIETKLKEIIFSKQSKIKITQNRKIDGSIHIFN